MIRKVEAIFECFDGDRDAHGNPGCRLHETTNGDDWPDFTKYTPGGDINMLMDEDAPARDFFETGSTYRVTFEKVEE